MWSSSSSSEEEDEEPPRGVPLGPLPGAAAAKSGSDWFRRRPAVRSARKAAGSAMAASLAAPRVRMSLMARWRCICRMVMADSRARTSGLASKSMGTGAGGGMAVIEASGTRRAWVYVWRSAAKEGMSGCGCGCDCGCDRVCDGA